MELTHRLTYNGTTTIIKEPIGFDSLKVQISRHEYHGIGAESSMDALEFYGNAIDIISDAYATDIDSSIVYDVLDGSTVIYTGKLDLSTYKELRGDYRSISCRVGEIGDMTTFNNRTDKDIDLDDPKTVDGDEVDAPDWMELHIPKKSLLYTNQMRQVSPKTMQYSFTDSLPLDEQNYDHYIFINIGDNITNEFGTFENKTETYEQANEATDPEPQYSVDEDFEQKYGTGTIAQVDVYLNIDFTRVQALSNFRWEFYVTNGTQTISTTQITETSKNFNIEFNVGGQFNANKALRFYFKIYSSAVEGTLTINPGSYVRMTMFDTLEDDAIKTKMLLVRNALETITKSISENALEINSDWYSPLPWLLIGGGALKALTNGYKIRGLFTDGENKRNMPLSFKSLIESLSALDCIGWGFSTENGSLCVRVEPWSWFYKDNVVLTLANVAEITREVLTDRIPTEFKIGYKKYATQDQYNSIDSPHGTRTYNNAIKALSKSLVKECEFIADNYAIEETRRARTQVSETEETTYDENIFVFELTRTSGVVATYKVDHTAVNAENVGRANEFINAKLTPRHMAVRWMNYLFATNNSTPFRFTTGEINYKAKFGVIPAYQTISGRQVYSLDPGDANPTTARMENEDLPYTPAKFKAEKITFSYPLTIEQYKSVKANPYGIIRATDANGVTHEGWIMDFRYSFQDGMADFTLIVKN